MKLLLALLAISLASCATKPIVVSPIRPAVVKAREQVVAVARSSGRVQTSIVALQGQAAGLVADSGKLAAETARMRRLEVVPAADWDAFQALADSFRQKVVVHDVELRAAVREAKELEVLQGEVVKGLDALAATAEAQDKGVEKLKEAYAKQAPAAALGGAISKGFWGLVVVILVVVLGYLIVKFVIPFTKILTL